MVLESVSASFAGSDTDDLFNTEDPHLSVTNLSCLSGRADGIDHVDDLLIFYEYLDPYLWYEIDGVLRTTVGLGVTLLATKSLDLTQGESLNSGGLERLLDLIKLERFDYCDDKFHI
jgi:hypothetical protein